MESVVLEQAASSLSQKTVPSPASLVAALLAVEKEAKKQKISYSFEQLLGTWRLRFVTGTKKSQERAGVVLGSGRYLPQFLRISLSYSSANLSSPERGRVENCVKLLALQLSLTGPVRFVSPKNILAFDFTRMTLKFLGATLYDGYIRSGKAKEESFYTDKIGQQAFFAYFYVSEGAIAARGRGGGLALWSRVKEVD
ncbi:MAG: hypothetical protein ACFB4I_20625 [Cyanophyceae cyanobacterium]